MASEIVETFPEIDGIEDQDLRNRVIEAFEIGLAEGKHDSLNDVPWAPHHRSEVGEQNLVQHIRDVTTLADCLAKTMGEIRDIQINHDFVMAGALVHDISKLFEHADDSFTEVREFLEHPHFSVYILESAGIPILIQHIALAHTPNSGVEPKTIESAIVHYADILAMDAIYIESTGEIKPRD